MQGNDLQRIQSIKQYCDDIISFMNRFGEYQQFITDRAYHNAVSMCILQIGELSNGLSAEFREDTKATIQWSLVRGMRNWVAHSYHELELNFSLFFHSQFPTVYAKKRAALIARPLLR